MADSLASEVKQDLLLAYYARRNGDLTEALRLYRLVQGGLAHLKETEKENLRLEFGDLSVVIREIQREISEGSGASKVRRIPVEYSSATGNEWDC